MLPLFCLKETQEKQSFETQWSDWILVCIYFNIALIPVQSKKVGTNFNQSEQVIEWKKKYS